MCEEALRSSVGRFKDKEIGWVGVAQEQRKEAVMSLHWIGVFVKG